MAETHRVAAQTERESPLLDTDGSPQVANGAVPELVSPDAAVLPLHASDPLAATLARPQSRGCRIGFAQGSLWGTAFNMCSAILGAGALSLPHAVGAMGLVPAVALLMFTAVATHYSVVLLVSAIVATGTRSFEDLSHHVFGRYTPRS